MIVTDRTSISLLSEADAFGLQAYYLHNADHLEPWEPLRPEGYHALSEW